MKTGKSKSNETEPARIPLDCARIAHTALALIDEHGIEQLSMRRIGAALGVEAMALYHHYRNKAELLDGVKDHLLDQLEARVSTQGSPLEQLRQSYCALRQIAIDHPDMFAALGSARFRTQRALRYDESLLEKFYAAGLNAEQAARYYRLLSNFTVGAGMAEIGSRDPGPAGSAPVEPLGADTSYPKVREAAAYLEGPRLLEIFNFGLDAIFRSMRNELTGQTRLQPELVS